MSLRSPALASVGVANLVDRVMCAQGPPRFSRGLCCPHRKPKSLDSIVRQSLGSCLESQQGLWPLVAGCWPASFLLPRHGGKVLSMSCVRCKPCPGRRQHSPIGYTALLEWAGSLRNLVLAESCPGVAPSLEEAGPSPDVCCEGSGTRRRGPARPLRPEGLSTRITSSISPPCFGATEVLLSRNGR